MYILQHTRAKVAGTTFPFATIFVRITLITDTCATSRHPLHQCWLPCVAGDARDFGDELLLKMVPGGFDTVLSDMCHNTLGCGDADAARSLELGHTAASIAIGAPFLYENTQPCDLAEFEKRHLDRWRNGVLKPGGNLIIKLLEGEPTFGF